MKYRFWIFTLIALLLVLLILGLWPRNPKQVTGPNPTAENSLNSNVASPLHTIATNSVSTSNQSKPGTLEPANAGKRLDLKRQALEEKNVPFAFFGRVVDQDSNGLANVSIKVRVRHWDIDSPGTSIPLERTTDDSGRFDIHDVTGDAFDIESIAKTNYELEPTRLSYGAVQGSLTEPAIFKMWRMGSHETLLTGSKPFHIVPDGRPYFISFQDDTISEAGPGNLKLWVKYANKADADGKRDWSCEIDVVNGGLLEETDGANAMYVAPLEGYIPSFELHQQIRDGQSGSIGEKRFFVKFNNGQEYGRITIELIAPYNGNVPGLVRLQYSVNPSASRVLR
jgi:hypothetical protein